MLFKICITIIFLIIYIIYEVWLNSKLSKEWIKKTANIIFTLIIFPICTTLIMPIFQKGDIEKEEKFKKSILDAIYSDCSNLDNISDIIKSKYQEIYKSTDTDTDKFLNELTKTIDSKKSFLLELNDNNKKIEQKYYAKWKPFSDLLIYQFDKIIYELKKDHNNINYKVNISDYEILIENNLGQYINRVIKYVYLNDSDFLEIKFIPAVIVSGKFLNSGQLSFEYFNKNLGSASISFLFHENGVLFGYNGPIQLDDGELQTELNPLDDEEFTRCSLGMLKKFITYVCLHSL